MANALFDSGRNGFLTATIDWDADNFKVSLIDHGVVTPNVSTHDFWNDLSTAAVATSANMTCSAPGAGVADASDVTLTSVSGAQSESLVIWKDTTVDSTSPLVAYIDTAGGTLPITPNGGNINIVWDNGANKIFKL